jgi:hypothetical protein
VNLPKISLRSAKSEINTKSPEQEGFLRPEVQMMIIWLKMLESLAATKTLYPVQRKSSILITRMDALGFNDSETLVSDSGCHAT